MPRSVNRLAIMTAIAGLALLPHAAVAKKPVKAKDRGAKVEGTGKKPASAQQRCRDERRALGAGAFAAKYGKPRTKGSAKARAKAPRAAFGRCVSKTAKLMRAEREAAEEEEAEGEVDGDEETGGEDGEDVLVVDDADLGETELPHGGKHGDRDAAGGKHDLEDEDDLAGDEDDFEDEDDLDAEDDLDDLDLD